MRISSLREKSSNLSESEKEIKQSFSRYYNKKQHCQGTSWGGRVQGNIFVNVDQMHDSVISPLNLHEVNPNRLRNSLTSVVRP